MTAHRRYLLLTLLLSAAIYAVLIGLGTWLIETI
jgi:cytochrome oxidase assembly protein ShyY1